MKLGLTFVLLLMIYSSGCTGQSSTPPGAATEGPPGVAGPGVAGPGAVASFRYPPKAVTAGKHFAVPPEEWGEIESAFGAKSIQVEGDEGTVRVDFFSASGDTTSKGQVERFKKMIEPASAIKVEEMKVDGKLVTRVSGSGTRRTLNNNDEPSMSYEGEGLVGVVFGSPDAELLIMVSGDADAVEAFAPKLDEWVKSFKQP